MNEYLLTVRDALHIAAHYGFSIHASDQERKLIRDSILQARRASSRPSLAGGGRHKSAMQYFHEYMTKAAADARKARNRI
jgi:hypothetical protein